MKEHVKKNPKETDGYATVMVPDGEQAEVREASKEILEESFFQRVGRPGLQIPKGISVTRYI